MDGCRILYEWLINAGIRKLAPIRTKFLGYSIVTPNHLGKLVVEAKKLDEQYSPKDFVRRSGQSGKLK